MSQFQVRTGPIQNDAAPFHSEMTAGSCPDQPRLFSIKAHLGGASPDTFYVPAPFESNMTAGSQPERNRERLLPHLNWNAWVVEAVVFSSDSVEVKRPDTPRLFSTRNQLGGWTGPIKEPVAPFGPEMSFGYQPAAPMLFKSERGGKMEPWSDNFVIVVVPFSIEMIFSARPDTPCRIVPTKGPSFFPWSGTAAPFTVDMVQGAHPDRSRAWLPLRTGGAFQTPDVQPFGVEMTLGSHPDQPRLFSTRTPRVGTVIAPDVVAPFSIDMTLAARPDQNRAFSPPKVGWEADQTTPVQAPVSSEMVQGQKPDTSRAWLPTRTGWSWLTPDVVTFSIDSIFGSRPEQPRLLSTRVKLGVQDAQLTFQPPFTPEMIQGSHPDQPRLTRTWAQQGWSVSQTTPTSAKFGQEMVQGSHPDRPLPARNQKEWSVIQVTPTTPPIFRVSWAQGSNRAVGFLIEPE